MANPLEHLSFHHINSAAVGTIVYPPGGHFARLVKQQTGKTPSEIRASAWGKGDSHAE